MTAGLATEVIVEPPWAGPMARMCMLVSPPQVFGAVASMTQMAVLRPV